MLRELGVTGQVRELPEPAPRGDLLVARYAQGRDYHNVVLKPARKLAAWLRAELDARVYCEVDAGAVLEGRPCGIPIASSTAAAWRDCARARSR